MLDRGSRGLQPRAYRIGDKRNERVGLMQIAAEPGYGHGGAPTSEPRRQGGWALLINAL
jgi:hypothetical protein